MATTKQLRNLLRCTADRSLRQSVERDRTAEALHRLRDDHDGMRTAFRYLEKCSVRWNGPVYHLQQVYKNVWIYRDPPTAAEKEHFFHS